MSGEDELQPDSDSAPARMGSKLSSETVTSNEHTSAENENLNESSFEDLNESSG